LNDLVKIYFVVSTRNSQTGEIDFDIATNQSKVQRHVRRIYGTGHYNRSVVEHRLEKCQSGKWFPEQHRARKNRDREDARVRKAVHVQYLKSLRTR
jgi:hypothetical protein